MPFLIVRFPTCCFIVNEAVTLWHSSFMTFIGAPYDGHINLLLRPYVQLVLGI